MLFATHSVKIYNPVAQQEPLVARVLTSRTDILTSKSIPEKYFAAPMNAIHIKQARLDAEEANKKLGELGQTAKLNVVSLQSGIVKQILMPLERTSNDYVSLSPLPSLALMDRFNKIKFKETNLKIRSQVIQPSPMARLNHGDPIASNFGEARIVVNELKGTHPSYEIQNGEVAITARVEGASISDVYLSTGLPSLSAVGGLVHVLERDTGLELDFAFGVKNIVGIQYGKVGIVTNRSSIKGNRKNRVIDATQIRASMDITILLKYKNSQELDLILAAASRVSRFAGGSIFKLNIQVSGLVNTFWYNSINADYSSIETVIQSMEEDESLKLISNGFALLSDIKESNNSRSGKHAWAEPTFKLFRTLETPKFFIRNNEDFIYSWG